MAQLKDTIISGSLRATDSLLTTTLQTKILNAPTESNGPSYGPGSNNDVLKSNATSIFWGTLTKSEVGLGSVENTALSTWTGTNKITTLGTVTTGTWSATKINPNKGGTGIDSYTKGDILYASANIANTATTALSKLAIGTAGYTLQATANGPAWTQTVAVANGGTGVTTWTKGGIVYASAKDTFAQIADGTANKVLYCSASATYSWLSYTSSNTASTIVYRDASNNFSAGTITATLSGSATSLSRRASLTKGTNPSSSAWFSHMTNFETGSGTDTKNRIGGYMESMIDTDGSTYFYLRAYQYAANSTTQNTLMIGCDKNGNCLYSLSDAAAFRKAINIGNGRVFYGTCNTAAATTLKEVICESYDKVLTNGDVLIVKFANTNSGAVGSLQITVKNATNDAAGSTAKNIKRLYNTTGASNLVHANELHKDAINVFVYNGTYWIMINGDYNNTYDGGEVLYSAGGANRTAETAANGGIGLHRYSLEMMTINQTWSSIASKDSTAIANTTSNDKVASTAAFLLNSPIYYQSTNTQCAPGGAISVNGYTCVALDLRYSCGSSTSTWSSLTIQKPVYLIGTMYDKVSFKLNATKWWGQNLPTTNDGKIYIYLGMAYSANNIYLAPYHPIYWHDGFGVKVYNGEVSYGTTLPSTGREGQLFYQISDPWYELPGGGGTGQVLTKRSNADRDVMWSSIQISGGSGAILRPDSTTKYYVAGSTSQLENTDPAIFNTAVYVENSVLMGAAWNDYAEYRKCNEKVEPGRCIIENGDGSLSLSTKRLQGGAEIVSDTFGFAIGKTNECNIPIAVSGRVLAYINENLKEIKIGAPVCSGPNGTVSQMTEDEARNYPWLIIGTISSIPQEEEWGQNKIKVNNRIWIRVR